MKTNRNLWRTAAISVLIFAIGMIPTMLVMNHSLQSLRDSQNQTNDEWVKTYERLRLNVVEHNEKIWQKSEQARKAYEVKADSFKTVIASLKKRAYVTHKFVPVPGTPCDTAITVRDEIIDTQGQLLIKDSTELRRVNTVLDSVQVDFSTLIRMSEDAELQWKKDYAESEDRNKELDKAWRRKRRKERIVEVGVVVLTVILSS